MNSYTRIADETDSISFKSVLGQLSINEAEGIVECFAAGIGNKDSVGDVLIPGAFDGSLRRRKPRVVWGHDWNHPIGKVLECYEVGPNDPRLPPKMKAAGIGGLYAKVQFNLRSQKGKEAFENIIFFGEDQEWSIGYKTLDSVFDGKLQANILKEVELYEMSPVLHGANQLTSTISFKSLEMALMAQEMKEDGYETDDERLLDEHLIKGIAMLKTFADANPDIVEAIELKREFTAAQRDDAADSGAAMSDGSFPIKNASDLRNAIKAVGRAKDSGKAKAHIKKRARALGLTNLLPDDWKTAEEGIESKVRADIPTVEPDVGPADITHGHGPHRGNLGDLLKYWRPIMKKPGGFRRCLVILADHPELGPLPNICAWLHHETTGRWPAEPGDKTLETITSNPASGKWAALAKSLADTFAKPVKIVKADAEKVVFSEEGSEKSYQAPYTVVDDVYYFGAKEDAHDCGGDCDDECCKPGQAMDFAKDGKSATVTNSHDMITFDFKSGRVLSAANVAKLQVAVNSIQEVIDAASRDYGDGSDDEVGTPPDYTIKNVKDGSPFALAIKTVNDYHQPELVSGKDGEITVQIKSEQHLAALERVIEAFTTEPEGN
jgi:HK97 family phage prohead protease